MNTEVSFGERGRLILGDARDVLPTLAGVGAVITDPPYGVALKNNTQDGREWPGRAKRNGQRSYQIAGDSDQLAGMAVLEWAAGLPCIFFASPWKPWPGSWRNLIVWDKGPAVGGGGDIKRCLKRTWELIQVARNGPMNGERDESVWRFPVIPQDAGEHPAAKPLELMRRLVRRFTTPEQTILDPFAGCGTTCVAAVMEGRPFIGVEIDPDYFAIAQARIRHAISPGIFGGLK